MPRKLLLWSLFLGLFSLSLSLQAHVMVAQHGTLNLVNKYAYLVLSLPMSAFKNVDDNRDSVVSIDEFNNHRKEISSRILEKIVLFNKESKFTIDGLLLSPEISHTGHENSIDQISITGRYTYKGKGSEIYFNIGLFGTSEKQKSFEITVLTKGQSKEQKQKYNFTLTPQNPSAAILSKLIL